jgi:hypothetical protein
MIIAKVYLRGLLLVAIFLEIEWLASFLMLSLSWTKCFLELKDLCVQVRILRWLDIESIWCLPQLDLKGSYFSIQFTVIQLTVLPVPHVTALVLSVLSL